MRKTFEQKLDEVTEDVIVMGSLVQNTVNDAINSLINGDVELAQKVIDGDDKIDDYDVLIEQKCMFIQAVHQPVAKDLRLIHSIHAKDEDYVKLVTNISLASRYLERIGDNAVNVGDRVLYYLTGDFKSIHSDFQ